MISCELQGGLGNMLFQIATTYSLALDNDDTCVFDFDRHSKMQRLQSRDANVYRSNIFSNLIQGSLAEKQHYTEPAYAYTKIEYKPNLCLNGYFQSELYFKHRRNDLLRLFNVERGGKWDDYTSVHIRRGDYIHFQKVHPMLSVEYYKEALSLLPNSRYIVFSDDIEWCRHLFKGVNVEFSHREDHEELLIMSQCKNNIIANSSFSWWGGWLNSNKDKKIVAPKRWFGDTKDTKDLYAEGWILI